MRTDISHITLPEDFNKISDFYIPDEYPKFGILYPGPIMILQNMEYFDFANSLLVEARKKKQTRVFHRVYA